MNPDSPERLVFTRLDSFVGAVPPEQTHLQLEFDFVADVLWARYGDTEQFRKERGRLERIAQSVFSPVYLRVAEGEMWLDAYKTELLDREGPVLKNIYLKQLAGAAVRASAWLLGSSLALSLLFQFAGTKPALSSGAGAPAYSTLFDIVRFDPGMSPFHMGVALTAVMWGIWLSFLLRNDILTFEQLRKPEPDMLQPWSRLLAYGLLAAVVILILQSGAVTIALGPYSASQMGDNIVIALLEGFALGFLDKMLPGMVREKLESLVPQFRGKSAGKSKDGRAAGAGGS